MGKEVQAAAQTAPQTKRPTTGEAPAGAKDADGIIITTREGNNAVEMEILTAYEFDGDVDSKQSKAFESNGFKLYLVENSSEEMVQVWMTPGTYTRYKKFTPNALPDPYSSLQGLKGLSRGIPGPSVGAANAAPSFGPKPLRGVPTRAPGHRAIDSGTEFQAVHAMDRRGRGTIKAVRIRSDVKGENRSAAQQKLSRAGYIPARTQSGQLVYIQRSDKFAWIAAGGLVK